MSNDSSRPQVFPTMLLTSAKPSKPIEVIPAPNPHTANRLRGLTATGEEVIVALRPSKGGVEFSKLLSGKIFSVAIDGCTPMYDVPADTPKTAEPSQRAANYPQKKDEATGLPMYSGAGVYLISTKDYPALSAGYCMARMSQDQSALNIIPENHQAELLHNIPASELLDRLEPVLLQRTQAPDHNWFQLTNSKGQPFQPTDTTINAEINRRRKRLRQATIDELEDNGETFDGPDFSELPGSPKDGTPFALILLKSTQNPNSIRPLLFSPRHTSLISRPGASAPDSRVAVLPFDEAWAAFSVSAAVKKITEHSNPSESFDIKIIYGWTFRMSVSFKKKVTNAHNATHPSGLALVLAELTSGWTRMISTIIYSRHPSFPSQDYTQNHFVAALHQAEIAMNLLGTTQVPDPSNPTKLLPKKQWSTPFPVHYSYSDLWSRF